MILYTGSDYSMPEMSVIRQIPNREQPIPQVLSGAILCLGNFDGFHLGHQSVVETARTLASRYASPLAMMSCEPHPRSFFGKPGHAPFRLASPRQKRLHLATIGLDYLFEPRFDGDFAGQSPEAFLDSLLLGGLRISGLVCGADFRFGAKRAGDAALIEDFCRSAGLSHFIVEKLHPASSTGIREAIGAGDFTAVRRQLGQDWVMDIRAKDCQIRPSQGRYSVCLDGSQLRHVIEIDDKGDLGLPIGLKGEFLRIIDRIA